jgi:superfamily I DNA/RNA helicase
MIARGVRRRDGRIAVVGDDRQAIYGFRGADSGSLDRLKLELGALEMGLTTTYRCGRSIVELAAKIVPDYVAAESNPAGEVIPLAVDKLVATAEPGDFVLSRKNSPLTRTALAFLRAGKRAKIAGRDLGASMRKLVRQLATGRATGSLPALLEKLTAWEEREIKRAEKAGEKKAAARIEAVTDLSETLRALAEDLSGVPELLARIDDLFVDEPGRAYVVCSSVHRAKGLEAENVFVLADTLSPSVPCVCGHRAHRITCDRCGCNLYREDPKAAREEENIRYVAITRAKSRLFMVVGLL